MSKVYNYIQEAIVRDLEKAIKEGGTAPWQKPWSINSQLNYITKIPYKGINCLLLPSTGEFITKRQIETLKKKNNNIYLRKGATSYMIVFWTFPDNKPKSLKDKEVEDEEDNSIKSKEVFKQSSKGILRYYSVFDINDVNGLESKFEAKKPLDKESKNELVENTMTSYLENNAIRLTHVGSSAYYTSKTDEIFLPNKNNFKSNNHYYSTVIHEISHSTGHKTRLNRFSKSNSHKLTEYSKEELIAEISTSMMLGTLGVTDTEIFDNSISYLNSWLKVLKKDITMITSASQNAQKAVNYILDTSDYKKYNI